MAILKKFASYLTFKKSDKEQEKQNFNLRMMHGINKISILMFLIGMIFLAIKLITK
jgi:hypothetical protein